MITQIENKAQFEELKNKGKVVIDFYADWCGPCSMLSPLLEKVANNLNIDVLKVNTDKCPDIAGEYNVMSIPTLVLVNNGRVIETKIGYQPEPILTKFLNQ